MPVNPNSKSEQIRFAIKSHPKATIRQLMEHLKSRGLDVTYGTVHSVKNERKYKQMAKKRRKSRPSMLRTAKPGTWNKRSQDETSAYGGFMSITRAINRAGGLKTVRSETKRLKTLVELCGGLENLEAILQSY